MKKRIKPHRKVKVTHKTSIKKQKAKIKKTRHVSAFKNVKVEQKLVLFICKGNAFRSIIAEALYNHYATYSKGISAGAEPAKEINPNTIKILEEIGIKVAKKKPTKFLPTMLKGVDKIVILCESSICKIIQPNAVYWEILDTTPDDIEGMRKIRDFLKERVKSLVDEVEGHHITSISMKS